MQKTIALLPDSTAAATLGVAVVLESSCTVLYTPVLRAPASTNPLAASELRKRSHNKTGIDPNTITTD